MMSMPTAVPRRPPSHIPDSWQACWHASMMYGDTTRCYSHSSRARRAPVCPPPHQAACSCSCSCARPPRLRTAPTRSRRCVSFCDPTALRCTSTSTPCLRPVGTEKPTAARRRRVFRPILPLPVHVTSRFRRHHANCSWQPSGGSDRN